MYVGIRDHKNFPLNALPFLVLPAHTLMVKGFYPLLLIGFYMGYKMKFSRDLLLHVVSY